MLNITTGSSTRRNSLFKDIDPRNGQRIGESTLKVNVKPILQLVTTSNTAELREPLTPSPRIPKEETPVVKATNRDDDIKLVKYDDIDHIDGPFYFHIWNNDDTLAITTENVTLRNTEDYMVMILRFPLATKGDYYPTPSAFIDVGFKSSLLVESYDHLVDIGLA